MVSVRSADFGRVTAPRFRCRRYRGLGWSRDRYWVDRAYTGEGCLYLMRLRVIYPRNGAEASERILAVPTGTVDPLRHIQMALSLAS